MNLPRGRRVRSCSGHVHRDSIEAAPSGAASAFPASERLCRRAECAHVDRRRRDRSSPRHLGPARADLRSFRRVRGAPARRRPCLGHRPGDGRHPRDRDRHRSEPPAVPGRDTADRLRHQPADAFDRGRAGSCARARCGAGPGRRAAHAVPGRVLRQRGLHARPVFHPRRPRCRVRGLPRAPARRPVRADRARAQSPSGDPRRRAAHGTLGRCHGPATTCSAIRWTTWRPSASSSTTRRGRDWGSSSGSSPTGHDPGTGRAGQPCWITDRTFPAGSLNQAIGGPYSRTMPRASWGEPS